MYGPTGIPERMYGPLFPNAPASVVGSKAPYGASLPKFLASEAGDKIYCSSAASPAVFVGKPAKILLRVAPSVLVDGGATVRLILSKIL